MDPVNKNEKQIYYNDNANPAWTDDFWTPGTSINIPDKNIEHDNQYREINSNNSDSWHVPNNYVNSTFQNNDSYQNQPVYEDISTQKSFSEIGFCGLTVNESTRNFTSLDNTQAIADTPAYDSMNHYYQHASSYNSNFENGYNYYSTEQENDNNYSRIKGQQDTYQAQIPCNTNGSYGPYSYQSVNNTLPQSQPHVQDFLCATNVYTSPITNWNNNMSQNSELTLQTNHSEQRSISDTEAKVDISNDYVDQESNSTFETRADNNSVSDVLHPKNSSESDIDQERQTVGKRKKRNKREEFAPKKFKDSCKLNCHNNLTDTIKTEVYNSFVALKKHDEKVAFIANLIDFLPVKNHEVKKEGVKSRKREYSYFYHLPDGNERIKVCKTCFQNTLKVGEKFIRCTMGNKIKSVSGATHSDKRGRHTPANKLPEYVRDNVLAHIKSFPAYQSHYSRRHSKKLYLQSKLSVSIMYDLYREVTEKPVSRTVYADIFETTKLKFKTPSLDTCNKCDILNIQIKAASGDEKKNLNKELIAHQNIADNAYLTKARDKELCHENDKNQIFSFDLQQVLQTPHLSANTAFYKRQLSYNLTIHNCVTNNATHFMWHEAIASRGSNEIASCLFKFIQSIPKEVENLIFYSDTCGGQNRNSNVLVMFLYLMLKISNVKSIEHKFLEPGHTHMECDVDHAAIERKKNKCPFPIQTPTDWYNLVRLSSKKQKFIVQEMQQQDFFNFAGLLKQNFQNKKVTKDGNKFYWKDIRWFRYSKKSNNSKQFAEVEFKNSLNDDEPFQKIDFSRKKSRKNTTEENLDLLYDSPRPISCLKKKDLLSLLGFISEDARYFYKVLKTDSDLGDTDPDVDRLFSDEEEN